MLKFCTQYARVLQLGTLCLLLGLFCYSACADQPAKPVLNPSLETNQPEFNLKQANKTFDQLNLKLSVENLNTEHLETAINTLNTLINDAKTSINFYQKKLDNLDNLLNEAETSKTKDKTDATVDHPKDKAGADLVYLKQEQKNIADKMAQCRLFIIRAQEAITTYQTALSKFKQQQVLTRGLPLWTLWDHLQNDSIKITETVANFSFFQTFPHQLLLVLGIDAILCALLSLLIVKKTQSYPFTQRWLRIRHIGLSDGVLLFVCLFLSGMGVYYLVTCSIANTLPIWLPDLLQVGGIYLWSLALINLLFKSKPMSTIFYWYSLDSHFFKNLLIFLLSYYTISQMGASLSQVLSISDTVWQFIQIIFLTVVILNIIGFFYYFCQSHRHLYFIHTHHTVLQRIIIILFTACGILNILGYHQMAMHLIYASITTFAIFFTLFLLFYAIQKIYLLCAYPSSIHRSILHTLGYRANQTVVEFIVLKITLQIIILGIGVYLIGQTWAYGAYYLNTISSQVLNGIHFGSFTFYPTRILSGIVVFCVLYFIFRAIATKLSRHEQFEEEEETQVAVASILIYIGFTCALVAALLISGIDFTGLAIVAGALSVGIGLGLQSIVNNFVSGLILLIEKPIKPGDHIHLDKIEGVVKKIRIRSTQLRTSAREDIIIPNSDLITRVVTNYMYTDRYLSISCEVGVAYDSDPALVKSLLLQAVSEHDEIIKSPRAKSSVLFHSFGESGMIFQLWFLIKDGNKKSNVRSDVNFIISRLFREHQIKIAHPLRDINIKLSEIPTKIGDK